MTRTNQLRLHRTLVHHRTLFCPRIVAYGWLHNLALQFVNHLPSSFRVMLGEKLRCFRSVWKSKKSRDIGCAELPQPSLVLTGHSFAV